MSEAGSTFLAFLFGIALGAVVTLNLLVGGRNEAQCDGACLVARRSHGVVRNDKCWCESSTTARVLEIPQVSQP